jgi:hypothetical protein
LEGTPTDPADVPNQRTASERSAAERAASLRAVFASSPRPGPPPETTPRRPGEPAVGRRPGVAPATGGQGVGVTPGGGSARGKRRRLGLAAALVVLVAIGGGAAFVATHGGVPLRVGHRTATVDDGRSTPGVRPTGAGVAGYPVPSDAPTGARPTAGPTSAAPTPSSLAPSAVAAGSIAPTTAAPVSGKPNRTRANLALRKAVESSTDEGSAYPASAAVDGDATTRWSSGFADPQWIRVDLAAVWQVSEVRLDWEHAYAVKYRVDISLDAKRWTTVYRTTSGVDGPRVIAITPAPARYVRVYGTQRSSQYGYSLLELEVR